MINAKFLEERPFEEFELNKDLDSELLNLNNNKFIFYIDISSSQDFNNFINDNIDNIRTLSMKKGFTFHGFSNNINEVFNSFNYSYFLPWFTNDKIINQINTRYSDYDFLQSLHYYDDIKSGFLVLLDNKFSFIGLNENEDIQSFTDSFFNSLVNKKDTIRFSKPTFDIDDIFSNKNKIDKNLINLDEETIVAIEKIESKLIHLKSNGDFIKVLKIIEELIKNLKVDNKELSRIVIDREFGILLPDYNNLEVKLSHLTKAVYILFLKHHNGIHLNDLHKHKNELLEIYKQITYQISYEKICSSVDLVTDVESGAIYQHLSRIKSYFINSFTDNYAKEYYIKGERNKEKKINLSPELIYWK